MVFSQLEFEEKLNSNKNFVVWEKIPSDLTTPVAALINISKISDHYCLFESVTGGEKRGRYSILAFDPNYIWKCKNKQISISVDGSKNFNESDDKNVFGSLKKLIENSKINLPDELPSMCAGVFGYMGYDMVKIMEDIPHDNPANIDIEDSVYFRPNIVIVFDNILDQAFIVHAIYNDGKKISYEQANQTINNVKKDILYTREIDIVSDAKSDGSEIEFSSNTTKSQFFAMVKKSIDYIKQGDIFQIVPSIRFESKFNASAISFYRSLRSLNPSPYLFLMNIDDYSIIGSSPEILVKVENGEVTVRPLAGTRKRGDTEGLDKALEVELLADKKEIAEHLMLLDLGRNDVGRVAKAGSIKISEKMKVERYSHVMHIVSNVSGKLRDDKDYMDALIAGFPAGTVSGAPKIRAMEIIDEIETEARQFFAGTVGYFSATGNMDTCIALRTALIKDKKIYLQAGAGVVFDSKPENEYNEIENKAKALKNAAKLAINYQ